MRYQAAARPDETSQHSNYNVVRGKIESLCLSAFSMSDCTLSLTVQDRVTSDCLARIYSDLLANHDRDPAVRHAPLDCLLSVHATFFAVLCHRLAAALHSSVADAQDGLRVAAMHLSYCARANCGVEIHPDATIGERLVIDHGLGTVIGQTVALGDDAYILNNVILGGRAVGDAIDGKRHPTIGHRVQISSGARILGPITVGDDCFIGADAIVTQDLPSNSRIVPRRGGCGDRPCLYTVQVSAATALTEGQS